MADGGTSKYNDLRYLFMRGLIQHERSQRSRHYLKQAAECTSKAIVSLELAEQPVKTVKLARKLEAIGGETCIRLTKLESERNFSCIRPLGGRFVSSAGGILVALADLTQEIYNGGHSQDKPVLVPETRVKERASLYTEESFQENNQEVFCPAWWRLEVLIKRGFIKRRSQKKLPVLQLVPLGKQVAQQLRDRNGLQAPTASIKLPELPSQENKEDMELDKLIEALDSTGDNSVDREVTLTAQAIQEQSLYTNDDGSDGLILLVDTQEMGGERVGLGEVCQLLDNRGVRYRTKKLKVADYSWVWRCSGIEIIMPWLVERKRADDLAETLKEGRFWTQVSRMVEWKGQFAECGVDVKLYYLLERRPEEYMVRCTDGCQGIGRCGNPTLRQLRLVIEDLRHHPQLLVRESDCLEKSVLFLASVTEEMKECITSGEFDLFLQQQQQQHQLEEESSRDKSTTRHRSKKDLSFHQSTTESNTARNRTKARPELTSQVESINDQKDITSILTVKQETNGLESDRMANLSYEEQVELAIQMSLKEEKDRNMMGYNVQEKESCETNPLNRNIKTKEGGIDRSVRNPDIISNDRNISTHYDYLSGKNIDSSLAQCQILSGICRDNELLCHLNGDGMLTKDIDSTLARRHVTSGQCRNSDVYYQDIDYEREDRDLEVAFQTKHQKPIKGKSGSYEIDMREDKELEIAIQRSKQDMESQSFGKDITVSERSRIGTIGLGEETSSHPLMQYHCSEGGSVTYPHQTSWKISSPDGKGYRPKMNRKRIFHASDTDASATVTSGNSIQDGDDKCLIDGTCIKSLKGNVRNGTPKLTNCIHSSKNMYDIDNDNMKVSDSLYKNRKVNESKKELTAVENQLLIAPSCFEGIRKGTEATNSENLGSNCIRSSLPSPWQSSKSDCDCKNFRIYSGGVYHERNEYASECLSRIQESCLEESSGQRNSKVSRNKLDEETCMSRTQKRGHIDSLQTFCLTSKYNEPFVNTEQDIVNQKKLSRVENDKILSAYENHSHLESFCTHSSKCYVDTNLDATDVSDSLSKASKPKRKKLNFSPSPAFTETNIVSVRYKNGKRDKTKKLDKSVAVVKEEKETYNTDSPVKTSDKFVDIIPTYKGIENYDEETRSNEDSILSKAGSLSQNNSTLDTVSGNNSADMVDSDEDLFPESEDKPIDIKDISKDQSYSRKHSEGQSELRKHMNKGEDISLDQNEKVVSACENHRHLQPFSPEPIYSSQDDSVDKDSLKTNSSSEDSNLSLPDLENQSPEMTGNFKKYRNNQSTEKKYAKENQSTENTEHIIDGNISSVFKTEECTQSETVYESGVNNYRHTFPFNDDSNHEIPSDIVVPNSVSVDHGILNTDLNSNSDITLSKFEGSIRTVMSVLPHVSVNAVRSTLKTCQGNVELCVSVLLESQSNT